MQLVISGLDAALAPMRFKHLWGRYVYGFKPWTHCLKCFKSHKAADIFPAMKDGTFKLEDRLFYLCGVGDERSAKLDPKLIQRVTNVHLAVYPKKGSVAMTNSAYGVTFTIEDAETIPIEKLPERFCDLKYKHSQCKNFQFGYQMFEVGHVTEVPGEIVHELRSQWRSVPRLTLTRASA